jgi:hypothetical protein
VSKLQTTVSCLPPRDVDARGEAEFKTFVIEGGQVNPNSLPRLYANALVLALVHVDGKLIGAGALKRPNAGYRDGVFSKAASKLSADDFEYELGWFRVLPEFAGNSISSDITRALMPHSQGASVYATSHIENVAMHSVMMKHGSFVQEGSPYPSQENGIPIQLYVRPWKSSS